MDSERCHTTFNMDPPQTPNASKIKRNGYQANKPTRQPVNRQTKQTRKQVTLVATAVGLYTVHVHIFELGGVSFGRSPPPKREMLCKRCPCVCGRVSVYVWAERACMVVGFRSLCFSVCCRGCCSLLCLRCNVRMT